MRVLIVGVSTRAMAESARQAGHDVVALDYFGDLDQKRLCESHSLRERGLRSTVAAFPAVARGLAYDALAYTGGLENHPAVVAELSEARRLLGNPPSTLAAIRDPTRLFPVLAGSGFVVPSVVAHGDQLPVTGAWLCKPVRSGGGQGIRIWRGRPPAPGQVLQEYIEGLSGSVSFVANGRRAVLLGVTRQLHGPRTFRYDGNLFPLAVAPAAIEEIRAIAGRLTRAFGLRGVNGLDFVLRGGRVVVVEVNPRYSASMELIERATGQSIFDLHLAGCDGSALLPAAEPQPGAWGKRIVYARATSDVGDTRPWLTRGVRDVPHPGERIGKGQPICTVLAWGATAEACERRLADEAAAIYQLIFAWSPA